MNGFIGEFEVFVARKERISERVVELTLENTGIAALPAWEPGAHIDLHLAEGLTRQYSLTGDFRISTQWRVAILLEHISRGGSEFVHHSLHERANLRVSYPRNNFPLKDARSYLFVAGGIGITPIVPMITKAMATSTPWRLIYGARSRGDMPYADFLRHSAEENVDLWPQDERGIVDLEEILKTVGPGEAIYACGPEGMLGALEERCSERALPLNLERFRNIQPDDSTKQSWEVELAASGKRLTVPADQSLLEVLRAEGIYVDSSCEEGTCGTCALGVLSGTPDHRDSVLTSAEREANDTMMACVSRSTCPLIVLDL